MTDHSHLRSEITSWIEGQIAIQSTAAQLLRADYETHNYAISRTFEEHVRIMKQDSVWGTDTELLAFTLRFHTRVVSLVNYPPGIAAVDSFEMLRRSGWIEAFSDTSPIFLFYHRFGHPMTPSPICTLNHFCLLTELLGSATLPNPYFGATEPVSLPQAIDLTGTRKDGNGKNSMCQTTLKGFLAKDRKEMKSNKRKSKTAMTAKERKQEKQIKLVAWLECMPVNKTEIARREEARLTIEEMERSLACYEAIECMVVNLEKEEKLRTRKGSTTSTLSAGRKELSWSDRSVIIYYHLHPLMGNCVESAASSLFNVNVHTIKSWLTKTAMRKRWIPMVKQLKFEDVLRVIPCPPFVKTKISVLASKIPRKLPIMQRDHEKVLQFMTRNSLDEEHQTIKAACSRDEKFCPYVKVKTKRIPATPFPKTTRNHEANRFVAELVKDRWNSGLPIGKIEVANQLLTFCEKKEMKNWLTKYGKNKTKERYIFVQRALSKEGFCVRKSTVSQKIPLDWRSKAEEGAARVRETFLKENVDVVIAADETFIRFHEAYDKVIAPRGEKRIGSAAFADEKAGCTVLPTMEMNSSLLLSPLIIFTGVFGATLMKQWKNYRKGLVLFTEKHWMTSETFVIYIKWILLQYSNKTIGLIIDYAPSHDRSDTIDWIDRLNKECQTGSRIVLEWIDKGLTSVHQPGDISVNKPLKDHIKALYSEYKAKDFIPGSKIRVSREKLVEFIEKAIQKINDDQKRTHSIYSTFKMCGLNPYDEDLTDFKKHLDSLNENKVYATLQRNNKALDL